MDEPCHHGPVELSYRATFSYELNEVEISVAEQTSILGETGITTVYISHEKIEHILQVSDPCV
jgi:ABC-type sugar transport system ATPase subunit